MNAITMLRRSPALHVLLVLLLGVILYSQTFRVPFLWDDDRLVVQNPAVRGATTAAGSAVQDEELVKHNRQRAVAMFTFALNYRLHGLDVAGYHAVNLGIHLLNAVLLYLLVVLTGRTAFLADTALGRERGAAGLMAALLFVAHPVQTEAVTYIFQRVTSLAALFSLLAMVLYVKAGLVREEQDRAGAGGGGRRATDLPWYVASWCVLATGMFVKENTVTIPLVIALYEISFFSGRPASRAARLAPFLLAMAIIPLHYLFGLDRSLDTATREYSFIPHGRMEYLFTQFRVIVTYLRLLVLPVHQTIDYDYPLFRSFLDPQVALSFLFLLGCIGAAFLLYRRSRTADRGLRVAGFGILWFFITLSLESSIIPLRLLINEYRVYLPSAGFFLALSASMVTVTDRVDRRAFTRVAWSAAACAVALLSILTFQRNALWADEVAFWEDTKRESPRKFIPPYNLGCALCDRGRYREAIREFQFTLTLNPSYHEAYEKLGEAYFKLGDLGVAEGMFREAARLKPDYARPHINLGILLDEQGRTDEALAELQKALVLDPGNARVHDDLGVVHVRRKEYTAAEREFLSALRLDPGAATVYVHLGIAYELQGRHEDAIAVFRTAVRLNSGDADAHYRLGAAYARLGRSDEARLELQQALALQPGHAAAGKELSGLQNRPGTTPRGGKK